MERFKMANVGASLAVQWLGLQASSEVGCRGRSLVGELRSHMFQGRSRGLGGRRRTGGVCVHASLVLVIV